MSSISQSAPATFANNASSIATPSNSVHNTPPAAPAPDCSWTGYLNAGLAGITDGMIAANSGQQVGKKVLKGALSLLKKGTNQDAVQNEIQDQINSFIIGVGKHHRQCAAVPTLASAPKSIDPTPVKASDGSIESTSSFASSQSTPIVLDAGQQCIGDRLPAQSSSQNQPQKATVVSTGAGRKTEVIVVTNTSKAKIQTSIASNIASNAHHDDVSIVLRSSKPINLIPSSSTALIAPSQPSQQGLIKSPDFSMLVDQTARQIGNFAGDLSGIVPAYKQIDSLMTQIAADPDKVLEILGKQFISRPTDFYNSVSNFPQKVEVFVGEFNANFQAGNLGATVGSIISIVGLIFAVMAAANEVLPIMNKLVHDIARKGIRHPKRVPEKVVKLMINTALNKVMSVKYLVKDFVNNPLKAGEHMVKGFVKTPEHFFKNCRDFVTGNRKARKKRRRMEEALRQQQIAFEKKFREEVTKVVGECFNSSNVQWMRISNEPLENYLQKLCADWFNLNKGVKRKSQHIDFLTFLNTIKTNLEKKHFAEVRRMSPTAHLKETTPPQAVVGAYKRTAVAAMQLEVQRIQLEVNIKAFDEATKPIAEAVQELQEINKSLKETNVNFAATIESVNETTAAINATAASLSATTARLNETNQGLRETNAGIRVATAKLDAAVDRFGETTDKLRTFLDTNEESLKEKLRAKLAAKKLSINK